MATKKTLGTSEEDQEKPKTTKAKTTRAAGVKKTTVKKKTKKEDEESSVDPDFKPLVYSGEAEEKEETPEVKDTAPKNMGGSMDAAKFAAPLSAASLHKQPMQAPTPSSFSMPPSTPAAPEPKSSFVPKMAPTDDGEILRDIKRREGGKDASFLAPEKFSFDLKKNSAAATGKSKWINILIYSLSTLIIVLTILLFILTFYSGQILKDDDTQTADQEQTTEGEQNADVPSGAYQFTVSNLSSDLQTVLADLVKADFKDNSVSIASNSGDVQLPTVQADTLFVKEANKPETNALMGMLAKYGIKPEIRQLESLPVSASLYFVSKLSSPDISGLTATVYNANGTAGLAKQYCDALNSYKVSNCQALNSTATQTGSTVEYKNVKALFALKRTDRFASAKFTQAPSGQIEDLKVTIGK